MKDKKLPEPELTVSTTDFFSDTVDEAFSYLKITTLPLVSNYLVSLLDRYAFADNLYDLNESTGKRTLNPLAEMFLKANQSEHRQKAQLLRKLGDTSLYISGFFGESLKSKVIDLDYYIDIGGSAYASLAACTEEDLSARVYEEFSNNFLKFVDALTYISQKSMIQSNKDLLRLYDRYVSTGSELARSQLLENGLLNSTTNSNKKILPS